MENNFFHDWISFYKTVITLMSTIFLKHYLSKAIQKKAFTLISAIFFWIVNFLFLFFHFGPFSWVLIVLTSWALALLKDRIIHLFILIHLRRLWIDFLILKKECETIKLLTKILVNWNDLIIIFKVLWDYWFIGFLI